jgi:hypothetical protein
MQTAPAPVAFKPHRHDPRQRSRRVRAKSRHCVVDCPKCGEAITFTAVDLAIVDLECLHCGHVGTYAAGATFRRHGFASLDHRSSPR